jgi:hypothetical protein
MLLQATRNPEHLSMSRDSNCTKQIRLGEGAYRRGVKKSPEVIVFPALEIRARPFWRGVALLALAGSVTLDVPLYFRTPVSIDFEMRSNFPLRSLIARSWPITTVSPFS